jgi:hypothetical protein
MNTIGMRCPLERKRCRYRECNNHIGYQDEQLVRELGCPSTCRRKSIIEADIAAFCPAQLPKLSHERCDPLFQLRIILRQGDHDPNSPQLLLLLRYCNERPSCRYASRCHNEFSSGGCGLACARPVGSYPRNAGGRISRFNRPVCDQVVKFEDGPLTLQDAASISISATSALTCELNKPGKENGD